MVNALTTLILLRSVDAHTFAIFASALVLSLFIGSFMNLGLEMLAIEASSTSDVDSIERSSTLHLLLQFSSLMFTPIVAFTAGASWYLAALLLAFSIGERRMNYWNCCLVGQNRSLDMVSINFISRLPPLLILLLPDRTGSHVTVLFFAALSVAGVTVCGRWSRSRCSFPSRLTTKFDLGVLRRSHTYWLASLGQQLRQLDLPLISALTGVSGAAAYAPASRLVGPMNLVPASLGMAIFPRAAAQRHNDVKKGFKIALLCVPLTVVGSLTLWLWGRPVFTSLIGNEYVQAWSVVCVMLAGLGLSAPGVVALAALQGYGRRRIAMVFQWTSSISYLLAVCALAPSWGAIGAAWGLASVSAIVGVVPSMWLLSYWVRLRDVDGNSLAVDPYV